MESSQSQWVAMFTNWSYEQIGNANQSVQVPAKAVPISAMRTDIKVQHDSSGKRLVTNVSGLLPMVDFLNGFNNVEVRFAPNGSCGNCHDFGHFHVTFSYAAPWEATELSIPLELKVKINNQYETSLKILVSVEKVRSPAGMNNFLQKLQALDVCYAQAQK